MRSRVQQYRKFGPGILHWDSPQTRTNDSSLRLALDKRSLRGTAEISVEAMYAYLGSNAAVSHCQVELA